jgi:sulfite reductase alpha subunit-like flavoprotein
VLTTLHLAISRPGFKGTKAAPGATKQYVQHLMKKEENAAQLWDLIDNKGAYVYVCGGTSMGSDVSHAVIHVVETLGGRSNKDAEAYMTNLKAQCRYVQELWA